MPVSVFVALVDIELDTASLIWIHQIQAVKERYPNIPDRMVLQDRPATIARVTPENGMEVMAHEFFTEQPVKGIVSFFQA